jgi:hypothetical protein
VERQNRATGLPEWAFIYEDEGLPSAKVLAGRQWDDVLQAEHPPEVERAIERDVGIRIDTEFKHVDKKNELLAAFQSMARQRFEAAGADDQDPGYLMLRSMNAPVRSIIGIAA